MENDILRARYLATGSATISETGGKMDTAFLETIFELQMRAMEDRSSVQIEAQQMLTQCKKNWTDCLRLGNKRREICLSVENTLGKNEVFTEFGKRLTKLGERLSLI